jgi:two-component system, chemotaxis family, sensor kinase CheA
MTEHDNEMLDLFVQESNEHLQTLEADLIALEADPSDADRLNRIFRAVHSIKGTAGFFGFSPIVNLAHVMENLMSVIRSGEITAGPAIVSRLIAGADRLALMIAAPANADEIPHADEIAALQEILDQDKNQPATAPKPASGALPDSDAETLPPELDEFEIGAADCLPGLRGGQNFFIIQTPLDEIEALGQTISGFFTELASVGTVLDARTNANSIPGLKAGLPARLSCSILFTTQLEIGILVDAFGLPPACVLPVPRKPLGDWVRDRGAAGPAVVKAPAADRTIVPANRTIELTEAPAPEVAELHAVPRRRKIEETVRINVSLLDQLMNLAGEMVLGRNQLVRLAEAQSGSQVEGLRTAVQEISAVTSNLQSTIMRARLHPVGSLFGKYTRVVRDLSQKLGKDIALEISGDEVELDRAILEGLSDPLTHLVRNSVDHGLELPAERESQGKSPRGTVRLSAAHLAGRVQIEVADDGRGMDPAKLKAKALEKGLITPEQASRMGDTEALQLIFAAGFSTAAQVSDISGRGVGMDVVRTNIEKLGGHIDLQSRIGLGTRIIIRLPLTLAIVPALIVGSRGQRYAMPQINLEEIVRPDADNPLRDFGGAEVLKLRDELLPVIRLASILDPGSPVETPGSAFVLALRLENLRFGLLVDEIMSTEEIVVKPLGRHLNAIPFYSGATLLGQGEIALILDPGGLAHGRIAASQAALPNSKTLALTRTVDAGRVLVFTDGTSERFAAPLTGITRVEQVRREHLERIGGRVCLRRNRASTLQLLRLGDILPVSTAGDLPEEFLVLVPKEPHSHVGIVATGIVDSTDLPDAALDDTTLSSPGIQGTALLLDRLTIVLDIPGVCASAGIGFPPTHEPATLSLTTA